MLKVIQTIILVKFLYIKYISCLIEHLSIFKNIVLGFAKCFDKPTKDFGFIRFSIKPLLSSFQVITWRFW